MSNEKKLKEAFDAFVTESCQEITTEELENLFDELLNDCHGFLPVYFDTPAEMMKENDRIMYDQDLWAWIDGVMTDNEWVEINDEIYKKEDIKVAKVKFIENLETFLETL